jgi:NAD kinase
MSLPPRAVLVHRATELSELVARHGTRQQAGFFLQTRGRDLAELDERHHAQQQALAVVSAALPLDWRRAVAERADLDRFVFGPEDVVIAVGQDGLVANVAKYLDGQPVIGINPEPARNPGVLVPHAPAAIADLLHEQHVEQRTMVAASTDDGQRLLALNEVYVGHRTHQSARYRLASPEGLEERQSSSGLLVGTGTGSTGWCRSAWQEHRRPPPHRDRRGRPGRLRRRHRGRLSHRLVGSAPRDRCRRDPPAPGPLRPQCVRPPWPVARRPGSD